MPSYAFLTKLAAALGWLLCFAAAEIPEHEMTTLPGWAGQLPSRQFSGLLPVAGGSKHLHYWYVESERAPARDPLVLWLNGGPGASSLIGLFTELGSLVTNDDSTQRPLDGVPALFYNPYSWSQVANLLYVESPAGVGFSYCEPGVACEATDETAASDLADFFQAFYAAYPELAARPLYLTGESYAGVYVPMLAEQLLARLPAAPLAGIAVGNGCWGNHVGLCSDSGDSMAIATSFFHAHSMFDDALWEDMRAHCDWYNVSSVCEGKVAEMRRQMGSFNLYNVYDTCGADQGVDGGLDYWFELTERRTFRPRLPLRQGLNDYKCGAERAMGEYLGRPEVVRALHVRPGTGGMHYTRTVSDLRPLYRRLSDRIRVLIYSGDVDGCVPTHGTETFFLRSLGLNVTEPWAPWSAYTATGSYVKAGYRELFGGTRHGIEFVTFNGAGHMVPQYRPSQSLTLMRRWLDGEATVQEAPADDHFFQSVPRHVFGGRASRITAA